MVSTWVWLTVNLLKSPPLFSVFWLISNYVVAWMVSTRPIISKSFSPFIYPLGTVPWTTITIGITVTFLFQSFYSSPARSRYLSPFSLSFSFVLCAAGTAKSIFGGFSFFLLVIIKSSRLDEIRQSVCSSKSQRSLRVSFSRTDSRLCIYHWFVWSN